MRLTNHDPLFLVITSIISFTINKLNYNNDDIYYTNQLL